MLQKSELASVVICYFPEVSLVKKLLAVLMQETGLVILVNNGGLEQGTEELQELFKGLLILNPGKNIGISAALNMTFELARKSGFTHVVSFDQDSNLESQTLRLLVDNFNALQATGANVAAIGPHFYDPRNSTKGGQYSVEGSMNTELSQPTCQSYIITSGCLASIEGWNATEGFDELLFIDLVDVDWCWRLRSQGYKVYMSLQAEMAHQLSDGTKSFLKYFVLNTYSPIRRYYLARNSVYLAISNKTNFSQKSYLLKAFLFSFISASFADKKKVESVLHIFSGAFHALSGRMGAYRRK